MIDCIECGTELNSDNRYSDTCCYPCADVLGYMPTNYPKEPEKEPFWKKQTGFDTFEDALFNVLSWIGEELQSLNGNILAIRRHYLGEDKKNFEEY